MGLGDGADGPFDVFLLVGCDGRVEGGLLKGHREPEDGPRHAGQPVDVEGHRPVHVRDQPGGQRQPEDGARVRARERRGRQLGPLQRGRPEAPDAVHRRKGQALENN